MSSIATPSSLHYLFPLRPVFYTYFLLLQCATVYFFLIIYSLLLRFSPVTHTWTLHFYFLLTIHVTSLSLFPLSLQIQTIFHISNDCTLIHWQVLEHNSYILPTLLIIISVFIYPGLLQLGKIIIHTFLTIAF